MTWEEAAAKYNFVRISPTDGSLELFADHHMLSTLRTCEGYFKESIIESISPTGGRAWYLEMGIWFHACLEEFYGNYGKLTLPDWVTSSMVMWNQNHMEEFNYHSGFKKLGGSPGAVRLLTEYWQVYGDNKETLKVIGCELSFGKAKEVPVGEFQVHKPNYHEDVYAKVSCFLTGRIDNIVTDGYSIMAMDTKTKNTFDGGESTAYKPHDGMLGYTYALSKVVKTQFPDTSLPCNKAIVNHVQIASGKDGDFRNRFKRSFYNYAPTEFEAWRQRQLRTFQKLYEIVIEQRTPDWDTLKCNGMFGNDCPYKMLHSHDEVNRKNVIQSFYTIKPAWNPYRPPEEIKKEELLKGNPQP